MAHITFHIRKADQPVLEVTEFLREGEPAWAGLRIWNKEDSIMLAFDSLEHVHDFIQAILKAYGNRDAFTAEGKRHKRSVTGMASDSGV